MATEEMVEVAPITRRNSGSNQDMTVDMAQDAPPMVSLMSNFRSRPIRSTRQHQCSMCSQTFARNEHLIRHERSHRGEKPFRCSICNTQFTRKELIKRHIRRQHPAEAHNDEPQATLQGEQPQGGTNGFARQASGLLNPVTTSARPCMSSRDSFLSWKPSTTDSSANSGPQAEPFDVIIDAFDFNAFYWSVGCGDGIRTVDSTQNQPDPVTMGTSLDIQETPSLLGVQFKPTEALPLNSKVAEQVQVAPESDMLGSFEISKSKRDSIAANIKATQLHDNPQLPSCLQLERFVTACFDSLFSLLPCVHLPTWRAEDAQPCLLLAMTSLGAKYSKKHDIALALHKVAHTTTLKQVSILEVGADGYPQWLILALFLVMCFGSWSGQSKLSEEALTTQHLLGQMFRSGQITRHVQVNEHLSLDWAEWVTIETAIRTRYVVYQYFSLMTRTFNLPPTVCNSEIDLPMPSSDSEWTAPTSQDWLACHVHSTKRPLFLATLDSLLGISTDAVPFLSPFGAHIILHALLQQLWHMRQDRWSPCSGSHIAHLRLALEKWEAMAQLDQESSISPCNSQAILSYNSHSLLRLARLALCEDLGSVHITYLSHSIDSISKAMMTEGTVSHFALDTQAALLATQSLRVPLKVGVALNSGCGSLQYQLFTLDSGLYLSRWLHNLLIKPEMSWSQDEREIVTLATSIIHEVDLPFEKSQKPLSSQIAYACCMILGGINTWGVSGMLLNALEKYADNLTTGL